MLSQPAAASREGSVPSIPAESLDNIRQLTASPLDEASATKVLTVVLEAIHLHHGALLRYDPASQGLDMLAEAGLAQQAVDAIRRIRRGASGVWDMPLHAVLQRRVYIIDRPKENPFVPTLLQGSDQGVLTNAALIPLFCAGSVTGALLLVGSGKRAIRETDVVALREAAKCVGAALRLPPKAGRGTPHLLTEPVSAPRHEESVRDRMMLTARITELESLVESLRRAAASSADTERRIADVTRDRDRYKSEAALSEIALKNVRAEHDLFRDQSASEAERGRKMALELARAREELAAAVESGQRSAEELEHANRSRAELERRVTDLERQLGENATAFRAGETARAELASRLAVVERETGELTRQLRAREEQIGELRGERERLTASLQKAAERHQAAEDATEQLRESSDVAQSELRAQVEALQARIEAAERERDQLSAGLAGRSEVIREIERETEKFRAELAREIERRRVAEQTASSVIHDAAALRAEAERVQAERQMAHADAERARSEAQQHGAELEKLRKSAQAEIERLRAEAVDLARRVEEAESARHALATDLERLRPDLEMHRKNEAELRSRAASQEQGERARQDELNQLRERLDKAMQSAETRARERDSLLARATTLQETTGNLLREGEILRADRERRDEELEALRAVVAGKTAEADRFHAEVERLRATVQRAEADAGGARAETLSAAERTQALDRKLTALRSELERAQSRGSELTAELARRAQLDERLEATSADLGRRLEESERRRLEDELQRKELHARLQQLEQALEGASADLAEKAHEVDFAAVLRGTLAKSESTRRTAEESAARLEAALETERQSVARLRAETDSERETAHELARRLDDLEQKLADAEESTTEANQRAALLASEHAAAQATTESLAADLGRRTAELAEASNRFEAAEREVRARERAVEQALERMQALEETARIAAQEIDALKRQAAASHDDKERRVHELELRVAETGARGERIAVDLKAAEEERERLREALRALENERRQTGESLHEAAAKTAALEAAALRGRSEAERLEAETDAQRQRADALENGLRSLEAQSARWRSLAEELQTTLEERDRDIRALQSASTRPAVAAKPRAPQAAAAAPKPSPPRAPAPTSRTVVVLDEPGPAFDGLAAACGSGGFETRGLDNGASPKEPPAYTAVNLLANKNGGLEGLLRSRSDEVLAGSGLFIYAAKPGGAKGIVFGTLDCLIRPIEEQVFLAALSGLLGGGKRVTIIGEELDSVLKLNAWATAKGCSVSSAGDLKQGSEILDIVKPDLIVFDFSRLGTEGAGLVVKARRSTRLEALPLLIVLPAGGQTPTAGFFMKRMAALADETPLDFTPVRRRLGPAEKK